MIKENPATLGWMAIRAIEANRVGVSAQTGGAATMEDLEIEGIKGTKVTLVLRVFRDTPGLKGTRETWVSMV